MIAREHTLIQIRLDTLLDRCRLSQPARALRIRTHHSVSSRLARGDTSCVDLSVLDRICTVLECQPSDLLRFVPEQPELFEAQDGNGWTPIRGPEETP